MTSLHVAAAQDSVETIRALVSCGADMEILDLYDRTPLFLAVDAPFNSTRTAHALIEAEANLYAIDADCRIALEVIWEKRWQDEEFEKLICPFVDAGKYRKAEALQEMEDSERRTVFKDLEQRQIYEERQQGVVKTKVLINEWLSRQDLNDI